ncbi:MAG: 7-carboxy-7-deazaguanine synthase QueE, partial [Methylophilaceae bacterium]|nr:7-carboxy-7-deazaguanine synthase QueE [Methylophilaceae bacterium]
GGGFSIATLDPRVMVVLDIKTPASGEVTKNVWQNTALLKSSDEVKFVLNDRQDYDWAKRIVDQYQLTDKCTVLFSPVYAVLNPTILADWLVADKLAVRMQVQLHKILWGEVAGK